MKKVETYVYEHEEKGKILKFPVKYTLCFTNKKLVEVKNQYGCSIEVTSQTFEYFKNKYKVYEI